ncbi:MAG: hypothetical protein OXE84_13365 [Rhodobacteraceae bacterium]|nr:hypothetical protein [Paracoccaceae bacterium]MCY4198060.1 hypothetical protein [Paracoccaceae bacterium]MCY4327698.1 hypothetical protein [Paracoccaceae bacterium]
MKRNTRAWLFDIDKAHASIKTVVSRTTRSTYLDDEDQQIIVNYRLITIGEALNRLDDVAPDLARKIPELRKRSICVTV